jgi:putative RecB family exonuclease
MLIYSYSQLNTYGNCPLQYKLRYRDRIKRYTEGVEAFLGKMVHQTLEKCYNDVRLTHPVSLPELHAYYESIWQQNWHDEIAIVREGVTAKNYLAQGRQMLERYYHRYAPFQSDITLGTEVRLNFSLDGSDRYKFIGYVDRLCRAADEVYEIQDYKTGGRLPTQAEADDDRQLALYQIGLRQRWPDVTAVRLVWYYLAFDEKLVSTRDETALAKLEQTMKDKVDEIIDAEEFPPQESALCDWCEYPDLCPLRKHYHIIEAMPPEAAAVEPGHVLVERYGELRAEISRLTVEKDATQEALVEYARRENAEVIRGREHQVRVKFSRKLKFPGKSDADRGKLDGIIRHAGRWDELSQLDTTALEKSLGAGNFEPDIAAAIHNLAREEETCAVYLSKFKSTDETEKQE